MKKLENLTPEQRERVAKLLALAQQGVGGEKTNAETLLRKLLAQHGLTVEDMARDEQLRVKCLVKYNHPYEKKLFMQVVYTVLNGKDWDVHRYNGTRTIFCEVTPMQRAEILLRYELYLRSFKAEIDVLMEAFIMKQRIYPADPSLKSDRQPNERERRAMELSRGLQQVDVHTPLEDKRGKKA